MSLLPPGAVPDDADDEPVLPHPPLPPRQKLRPAPASEPEPRRVVPLPAALAPHPADRARPYVLGGLVTVLPALVLGCVLGIEAHRAWEGWRPGPEPAPSPAPVEGKLWVTLVKSTTNPTQDFAQLEADPQLTEGIPKLGAHLSIWEDDNPNLEKQGLTQYVKKAGVPALLVQAEGSSKVVAVPCPKTAPEVIAVVKKFKGGR